MVFGRKKPGDDREEGKEASLRDTYLAALEAQREEKDHFFAHHGHSPIPPEERETFEELRYWPPAAAYQQVVPLEESEPTRITFQTSTGDEQSYTRIGTVTFSAEGEMAQLAVYEDEEGGLFLPFRDATSGDESYGAGRYLEPIRLHNGDILLDFNLAYNPFCAYAPEYICPLPPLENWLKVPIRAGEKDYKPEPFDPADDTA